MAAVARLVVVLDQVRVMLEVKLMQGLEAGVVVPAHRNMEGLGLALDLARGLALVLRIGVMGIWYLRGSLVPGGSGGGGGSGHAGGSDSSSGYGTGGGTGSGFSEATLDVSYYGHGQTDVDGHAKANATQSGGGTGGGQNGGSGGGSGYGEGRLDKPPS